MLPSPRALDAITKRLAANGDHGARFHAAHALEALREAGYHLITAPTVTYDPPEGTPEFEAIADSATSWFARHPESIRRVVRCEVDGEVLTVTIVVSPEQADYLRRDRGFKEHIEREQGYGFIARLWQHLAPNPSASGLVAAPVDVSQQEAGSLVKQDGGNQGGKHGADDTTGASGG